LRDEIKRLQTLPQHDVRVMGLSWAEAPGGSEASSATAEDVGRRMSSGEIELLQSGKPFPGVLDVTSRMWGSSAVMVGLLNHLYSRPVQTTERMLPTLRVAALSLGVTELARSCDEACRKFSGTESRPCTPDTVQVSLKTDFSLQPKPAEGPRLDRAVTVPASSQAETKVPHSKSQERFKEQEPPQRTQSGESTSGKSLHAVHMKTGARELIGPPAESAEARGSRKTMGERSFLHDKAPIERNLSGLTSAPMNSASESGGVRRVLSEIKRSMAESSRIIADQTFQQIYEMVPGERGILGEGINGPVRMATHRKTGKEVAVKRISCMNLSEQRRQMLVSEVSIFLQVSHRNIVQLLEVYESGVDQAVLLVMELCTGKELFERLAEQRWYSEFAAARVTRQMLDAVSYLHSQNICHRDLKLENWLYESPDAEAKLKLCDFGFGQIVEPEVQLTATLGSLFYVAPEVLEGSYGLPCDMWSVGVICYMLLAGVPPFDGKTDADVTSKIKLGRFVSTGKRWEGISESAKHFVRSLLRKDPYERLAAAEAAQHAWLKMDQGNKVSWPKGLPDAELELPIDRGVIRDMWKFAQNNAITRAALGIFSKMQSSSTSDGREEDVNLLDHRFRVHDEQNTGKVSAETFIQVLKESLHVQISSAEEKQFFERIAGNLAGEADTKLRGYGSQESSSGTEKGRRRREVNYREFIELTKARRMANNTAAIREAFRAFDEKGDGYIKENDMHSLLGDEFKATIEDYVGANGMDIIDYKHFANVVSKEMALKDNQESANAPPGTEVDMDSSPNQPAPAIIVSTPSGISQKGSGTPEDGNGKTEANVNSRPTPTPSTSVSHVAAQRTLSEHEITPKEDEKIEVQQADAEASPVSDSDCAKAEPESGTDEKASRSREKEKEAQEEASASTVDHGQSDEEDCDADAQSDEEQLVNVKGHSESDVKGEGEIPSEEKAIQKGPTPSKDPRYGKSFSLSLAGSSEYDDSFSGVNRVLSMPSDVYHIKQMPGFHARILKPFYAARPVSNVVMGLIRGTSLYAKQSVYAKLATVIHTSCGWFFIMPNPKYHTEVDSRKGLLSRETGKFRFVAWWIHPRFVPQMRQWFQRLTSEDKEDKTKGWREPRSTDPRATPGEGNEEPKPSMADEPKSFPLDGPPAAPSDVPAATALPQPEKPSPTPSFPTFGAAGAEEGLKREEGFKRDDDMMGSPGDFRFSDVPKPDSYLHTYRDLHSKEHLNMLLQLREGTYRFLRSLFDENFMAHAQISAGFHYPVRTQYATMHMQVRVNSGSVCREDGRGIEVDKLIEVFKHDRSIFERDSETLRYQVTENVKVSLLAAAQEYEEQHEGASPCRQLTPSTFELGAAAMPTIQDNDGDEDEENEEKTDEKEEEEAETERQTPGRRKTSSSSPTNANSDKNREGNNRGGKKNFYPRPDADLALSISEGVADGNTISSYLVNLQPSLDSAFHQAIYKMRQRSRELYGPDPTHLYPLHVSVTGFFEATGSSMRPLMTGMQELLQKALSHDARLEVGEVICTSTGYVLYDMIAPQLKNFSEELKRWSTEELGLSIRPKAVNHISLACDRKDEATREKIRAIFDSGRHESGGKSMKSGTFDLVLSRLLQRGSFEKFDEVGPHRFLEVSRIPVYPAEI